MGLKGKTETDRQVHQDGGGKGSCFKVNDWSSGLFNFFWRLGRIVSTQGFQGQSKGVSGTPPYLQWNSKGIAGYQSANTGKFVPWGCIRVDDEEESLLR